MGDQISINGNYQNVILNIKSTLTNVQQSVGAMTAVDDAARQELQRSIAELSKALEQIPASLKEEAEAVASAAQMLVESAKSEKPNKTVLEITAEGLKKAAAESGRSCTCSGYRCWPGRCGCVAHARPGLTGCQVRSATPTITPLHRKRQFLWRT